MAGHDPLATNLIKARTSVGGTTGGPTGLVGQVLTKFGSGDTDYGWASIVFPAHVNPPFSQEMSAIVGNSSYYDYSPSDIDFIASKAAGVLIAVSEETINSRITSEVKTLNDRITLIGTTGGLGGGDVPADIYSSFLLKNSNDSTSGVISFTSGLKAALLLPTSGTDILVGGNLKINNPLYGFSGGKYYGTGGSSTTSYVDTTGTEVTVNGAALRPVDSAMSLGTVSKKWKEGFVEDLKVGSGATSLLVSNLLNTGLIPMSWINSQVVHPSQSTPFVPTYANASQLMSGEVGDLILRAMTFAKGGIWDLGTTEGIGKLSFYTLASGVTSVSVTSGHLQIGKLLINFGLLTTTVADNWGVVIDMANANFKWKPFKDNRYAVVTTAISNQTNYAGDQSNSCAFAARTSTTCPITFQDVSAVGGSFILIGEAP